MVVLEKPFGHEQRLDAGGHAGEQGCDLGVGRGRERDKARARLGNQSPQADKVPRQHSPVA